MLQFHLTVTGFTSEEKGASKSHTIYNDPSLTSF
jgi:hypothetical protein